MKKFKVTGNPSVDTALDPILNETNILKLAFLQYSQLPLGLLAALLMIGNSLLIGRPLLAMEHSVFFFMAISTFAFYQAFAYWATYQNQRLKLQHTRNPLLAHGFFPVLFGGLFVYSTLPLGNWAMAIGFVMLLLMVTYSQSLSRNGRPLKETPWLRAWVPALLLAGLLSISSLAPDALRPLWGLGAAAATLLISGSLLQLRTSRMNAV